MRKKLSSNSKLEKAKTRLIKIELVDEEDYFTHTKLEKAYLSMLKNSVTDNEDVPN